MSTISITEKIMKHHYQVKFEWNGQTHYGVVDSFSPEAKKVAPKLRVEDAVLPICFILGADEITDIPTVFGNEYDKYVEAEYEKVQAVADKLSGCVVGMSFTVGVGDGNAFYLITQVKGARVKIEWRGFSGDRWVDQRFGLGGWVPKSQVAMFCRVGKPLFGRVRAW